LVKFLLYFPSSNLLSLSVKQKKKNSKQEKNKRGEGRRKNKGKGKLTYNFSLFIVKFLRNWEALIFLIFILKLCFSFNKNTLAEEVILQSKILEFWLPCTFWN